MDVLGFSKDLKLTQSFLWMVYYTARAGMHYALYELLRDIPVEMVNLLLREEILENDGQIHTPLIVAARYGKDGVVRMLLEKFQPDLEQEGAVKFDGHIVKGASALWCAAGAAHLNIVRTLVMAGADVNHGTETNSTPLRAASFVGRLDIVSYLINHHAVIDIPNKFNNTCLMSAAYKGHYDVVKFLLEKGADPNRKAYCGGTALHFAAAEGHTRIVRELLKYGSKTSKNNNGITPLIAAAEGTKAAVVEYFVSLGDISKNDTIDAYELLGASYANDGDNYDLVKAYNYMRKAMELRFSNPRDIVHKKLGKVVKAYDNWVECQTVQELDNIKNSPDSIHMESLAIRERILGSQNPEILHAIVFRGAVFADNGMFNRSVDLWLHALKLKQSNCMSARKDLLQFAQVFSQMIQLRMELDFSEVLTVLDCSVKELRNNKAKIQDPSNKDDVEQYMEEFESNIMSTLYILTIITKLLQIHKSTCTEENLSDIHSLVCDLCTMKLKLRDGQTLLHLAVNTQTPVDDFHTNDVCKFPCMDTVKLLINCRADVNAIDNERNTPLHVIASSEQSKRDLTTLYSIMTDLIEANVHMDTVNSSGKTPYDEAATEEARMILRAHRKTYLTCIAAKAINFYNLPYAGQVPRALEGFIKLHG